jgi:hypothetical protein
MPSPLQVSGQAPAGRRARAADGERAYVKTVSRPPGRGGRRVLRASRRQELVLDRYRLLERLGEGGFGAVWLAFDERLRREVAVKRIPRAAGADREERRRAAREALAAARLSHPAIVALYEAGIDEDAYYLVSELVRGQTLGERFDAGGLEDHDLLRIGAALADALAHAHARGIVHRDVKPANVIVPDEPGGTPAKLTDFGVARIAGEAPLTRAGDVIGTLAYMAPEQADGGDVGAATDVYSLALTIYEGLAGFNPVRGATPAATAKRIGRRLPPLRRARRDLPEPLCHALDRALSSGPAQRGELAELREAFAHPASARISTRRPGATHATPPIPRFARLAGALAAGALGAAALATGLGPATPASPLWAGAVCALAVALAPRAGFVAIALTAIGWLGFSGEPGAAALVLLAAAPAAALLGRAPWLWCAPALAPALGALGIAGGFPALAAQCGSAWRRAALGALGYWWLALAEPLYGRVLLLGPASGTHARATWQASVPDAFTHAFAPLLSDAGLAFAALWALAALAWPLLVRAGAPLPRALAAGVWALALVAASVALAHQAGRSPSALALAGAALAVPAALSPRRALGVPGPRGVA